MTGDLRPRPRGISVRAKLALSYAGFLMVAGVALFVVGFLLLRFVPEGALYEATGGWAPNRGDLLEVFVRYTWWAIAALLVFGLVGGWLLAGIVLRPLGRIADAAARARDGHLDERVALPGRRDELTDLADTLDGMLQRIERTIDEERRFAANASHELRTPHAIIRTMVEVAQADPEHRDVDELLRRVGATNDRAIATTEALLSLSRAGRGGPLATSRVDLAALVADVTDETEPDASARGIRLDSLLAPAVVKGDAALLAQLVGNLLRNAVVHNLEGGWVRVDLRETGRAAQLTVANSGAFVDPAVVDTLTEPFVRGAGRARSAGDAGGSGLGLAIVASIVRAHEGRLEIIAPPDGGLQVRVTLPR